MTVLEYGRNQIIVDCGVMFPENDMFGIDLVLPQFDYVIENQKTLRGIVLTHGHLDHIGGLPYLLQQLSPSSTGVPIYGTALTIGMVGQKLQEMHLATRAKMHVIDDEQTLHLGPFRISPFAVAHSIPGAVGLVIDTPVGAVVHTGDYKLDETPTGGRTTDLKRLRQLTPGGVLVMLGDSTNADQPGRTPTEQLVADTLDQLFAEATGQRIIVTTFSSVLARLQEIMRLAQKYGRKVAITGRSLRNNVELARDLGYLKVPKGLLVDIGSKVPGHKLVILSTGSQGEPRSALNLMAMGEHRQVQVHHGDLIIISGGTIPGNEEGVSRMLNQLFARGANVIYEPLATVHVSGHGNREDMRIMLKTVRPRFLIPVHGEVRHLHLHAQLAQECSLNLEDVFILQNGASWVTDGETTWQEEAISAENVLVDGSLVGDIGKRVVHDRQRLSQDGFVVAYVPVDKRRKLVGEPLLLSRGFLHMDTSGDLMEAARTDLKRNLRQNGHRNKHEFRNTVIRTLNNFFFQTTQSHPVILPNIVHV